MDYLKRKGEPVTYLMPANQAYYTGLGFKLLENSYVVPATDILGRYNTDVNINGDKQNKSIPDGIYYLTGNGAETIYGNRKYSISSEVCNSMLQDFNNILSSIYDVFAVRNMSYMIELDKQCKALGGHSYLLCIEGKIKACFGVMVENGRADIVQYIAAEEYLENLACIMKYLQYNWNDSFELFVNIKNLLSEEVKVDKGHGIMYNILDKNFSKIVNCDKMLIINEIV
jgi:hypothetical protein